MSMRTVSQRLAATRATGSKDDEEEMPAVVCVRLVIGRARRLIPGPGPACRGILRVESERPVEAEGGVIHGLVPSWTAPAELLGGVADQVRDGGAPARMLV